MSERDVLRACADYLAGHPRVMAWRCHSGKVRIKGGYMQLAPAGTADFVGVLSVRRFIGEFNTIVGLFIGIEIKKDDKSKRRKSETTEAQRHWRDEISERGGVALVVSSVTELSQRIEELLKAT